MSLQKVALRSGVSAIAQGVGLSLGMIGLIGSSAVPSLASDRSTFQVAQSTTPNGDVIVQPERQPSETGSDPSRTTDGPRFTCENVNGQYTVMYHPESQAGQSYAWANPTNMGGGWTAERRCAEITRRLESYRPDGLLEMRTSTENGYNIVCVTTERTPGCRIVFTVPPGQDPIATRDRVFQNLTVADSGQQTQGITTFAEGGQSGILNQIGQVLNIGLPNLGQTTRSRDAINLRPFLDRADGGTAERLNGRMPTRSNPRLNPGKFR